ncbi:adenosine kinase [Acaryochloris marina]|uniref:adenosine kinase n=1 Tax=Acaryochloris marina TaxID=155978 RepID=UPI001BAEA3EE|nr:adenosine kinase [Acaryochloris marina]QUY40456.1 adenosine kinase [Acaryochloris marina S15]
MAKYDVYGLGNALVDIECEVSVEVLQNLGVDKGVMTLLEEADQQRIIDHLSNYSLKRGCGGSAANTLIAVSQFGGKSCYSCKVANDEPGQFYLDDLIRCGVATNLQQHQPEAGVTGKCLVFVTPDADRTMNTFLGISGRFSEAELLPDAIANSAYTYIEGYLVTSPDAKAAAIKARDMAKAAGQKVSLTLSDFNMVSFFKDGLLEMIGSGLDLIFANESEALKMAETEDMSAAIEHMKTLATCFAITRGPQGSLIYDGQQVLEIAPTPVQAIDTVGAGDMYAGAVLYGITNGMSYTEAGQLGSVAAAKLVASLGPRMPTDVTRSLLTAVKTDSKG